jgi:aspartate racemase
MKSKQKILGILGGMGPAATAYFYQQIIQETKVQSDQEHVHVIIDSNCKIPDRSAAIKNGDLLPLLESLRTSAQRLITAGVDLIAIPCNTAHFVYDELQEFCEIEILHIVRETRQEIRRLGYKNPGLLATQGTIQSQLYQLVFGDQALIFPDSDQVEQIHAGVLDIKRGEPRRALPTFQRALSKFQERGADCVILACTEIPLAINQEISSLTVLDTSRVLARAAVARCMNECSASQPLSRK